MRSTIEAGVVRQWRQVNDAKAGFCYAWTRMTFVADCWDFSDKERVARAGA
jgi:hypothetical protein